MAKSFHTSEHRAREYDRPSQGWDCGHSAAGRSCPLGPSGSGKCRGTGECIPILNGDRWLCTRPGSRGGECLNGPTPTGACGCPLAPCLPAVSLRQRRKVVGIVVAIVTLGFILVVVSSMETSASLTSGQLSTFHSGDNLDCASCHGDTSLGDVVPALGSDFRTERAHGNSQLCLECHSDEIGEWEGTARFAHGWDPATLEVHVAASTQRRSRENSTDGGGAGTAVSIASHGSLREMGVEGKLDCATCHKEHRGPHASLTEVTNQQCQVCHQEQFESFAHGHPEFAATNYPYQRRTRIFFDHVSHYLDHFPDEAEGVIPGYVPEAPFAAGASCAQCHEPDDRGEFMQVRGYENSCAACHDGDTSGGDPLTVLAFPKIAPEVADGPWPKSELPLLPAVRLLLSDTTRKEIADEYLDEEKGAVVLGANKALDAKIADELRTLVRGAWEDDVDFLADAVEENGFVAKGEGGKLFAGLSLDSMRELLFPGKGEGGLGEFLGKPDAAGETAPADAALLLERDPERWQKFGGWFYEGNALHYRSQGHADPVVLAWIESAIAGVNSEDRSRKRDWRQVLEYTLQQERGVRSKATGKCFQCHTVERHPETNLFFVNWRAAFGTHEQNNPAADLTRFSHAKHFGGIDCLVCHKPEVEVDYADYFPTEKLSEGRFDRHHFASNFSEIAKGERCANCHQETLSGNDCTQCHNYHSHLGKRRSDRWLHPSISGASHPRLERVRAALK